MKKMAILITTAFVTTLSSAQSSLDLFFKPDSLEAIIKVLAADSMSGRLSGSLGCIKAGMYIGEEFKKAGLQPLNNESNYFIPIASGGGNIAGRIEGHSLKDEIIIFSAHYDHIGTTIKTIPFAAANETTTVDAKDTVYNGANDDASGVSAVISLGRYFNSRNDNQRTIVFVAFTGEEFGLLGSTSFASYFKNEQVKAVINIEMIGRRFFAQGVPYITGGELSDLKKILNNRLAESDKNKYGKSFIKDDPFSAEDLFRRSDNYPFAQNGIPAHTIVTTSPKDKYYHSLNDEASTLDYKGMSILITAIAIGSQGLIEGTDTPKKIKL